MEAIIKKKQKKTEGGGYTLQMLESILQMSQMLESIRLKHRASDFGSIKISARFHLSFLIALLLLVPSPLLHPG